MPNTMEQEASSERVRNLLNAIANLCQGDLARVLELNQLTPMRDFGPNDSFHLSEDKKLIVIPGFPPPPKSLKHRVRTGTELGRILESHLNIILSIGEATLSSTKKRRRSKKELGGRRF